MKITSFVLKIASRCNLNCSYCYMYNLGDKTYLNQPKRMSLDTIYALSQRIDKHCKEKSLSHIQIVFHGGEPLLVSKNFLKNCIEIFQRKSPDIKFSYIIQTNGVLLNEDWYKFLEKEHIKVGISIDGPQFYHDKFRVFNNGKGSYTRVKKAVLLGSKKYNLKGILNVINTDIPPDSFYQEMKQLGIESINLLLPDGHHDNMPSGFDITRINSEYYTPYADWLIELFKIWKKDRQRPSISFFETLIIMIMGYDKIGNQNFGKKKNEVLIIETNGGIEVADSLRACYEGITRNNLNVMRNEISDIFSHDIFNLYYNSHDLVCESCLNCSVYDICGGGFLGNRYSNTKGFNNRMIYCKDMLKLISFLQKDLIDNIPNNAKKSLSTEIITYEDLLQEIKEDNLKHNNKEVTKLLESFKI